MECKHEAEDSKFGQLCKKGHMFCMEERCPDFEPTEYPKQDA